MKKILKFYALLLIAIVIFLLMGNAIFPLMTESNTMANIFGWILLPMPFICFGYSFKWLYPNFIENYKKWLSDTFLK